MKVLNYLFAICIACFAISCGGDSCEAGDWVGTYTLDEDSVEGCDSTITFDSTIAFTAASDTTVMVSGIEVAPDTENCTIDLGLASAELDGDEVKVSFGACTATYK